MVQSEDVPLPKFKSKGREAFSTIVRRLAKEYFDSKGIDETGNITLYMKAFVLISSLAVHYYLLVFHELPLIVLVCLSVTLGLNLAMIGFCVMHDACHGSFSKKKWVNYLFGLTLNLMGGYDNWWRIKHNIRHHTYTNIQDIDEDIDVPFMRLHKEQPWRPYHRYQHKNWYWMPMYSLTYIAWILAADFRKYFMGKVGVHVFTITAKERIRFWISKVLFFALFVVSPFLIRGSVYLWVFFISALVCGFCIAVVFQMAHNVEGNEKPFVVENKIENDFMVHQLQTTANFACKNKLFEWAAGGLNFQIEHHLFPKVSHIHYPALQSSVKQACELCNLEYIEKPTLRLAVISHKEHLRQLGEKE